MMFFKGRWIISFDFRYNAARVASMVGAAREFLDVASSALKENRMRPFVDNLFSATELMAKGHLLLSPDEALLKSKKHTIVSARFNQERNLGNVEPRYVDLLNRLQDLRGSARYLDKDFTLTEEEAKNMIGTAEDMFETVRESVPERHQTSDGS